MGVAHTLELDTETVLLTLDADEAEDRADDAEELPEVLRMDVPETEELEADELKREELETEEPEAEILEAEELTTDELEVEELDIELETAAI